MMQLPEGEPVTPDRVQGMAQRDTLRVMVFLFPIIAVQEGS